MISTKTIEVLARTYQTTELTIRREYVQQLFLAYFYQQKESKAIFFKGGTALRIIYNSPRFSEDLDFNTSDHTIKAIEDAVFETLREIEHEGIETDIRESKKTSGGYLAILNFILHATNISLSLEVSFRNREATGEVATVASDFMPPYILIHVRQGELVAEKMNALLSRKKARDFYDLYFILRANLLPRKTKKMLPRVLDILRVTDINFEHELKLFLPKSHWLIIKDFKTMLEREIERHSV